VRRVRRGKTAARSHGRQADKPLASPLRHVDVEAVSAAARKEVKRRECYLPTVSVFRWWARRTSAVSGAVLDAVALDLGPNLQVTDPFAGGGTVAHAALIRGHRVYAQDIDPWAAEGIAATLGLPMPDQIQAAGTRLHAAVAELLKRAYATEFHDGSPASIAHTIRVAVAGCPECGKRTRLFPYATVSRSRRVDRIGGDTRAWLACRRAHVYEGHARQRSHCPKCGDAVRPSVIYAPDRRIACTACSTVSTLSAWAERGLEWEIVLVERTDGKRREISKPRPKELACADLKWKPALDLTAIEDGQETRVLIRHGFRNWHDLYPPRQRVVLEALFAAIPDAAHADPATERLLRIIVAGAAEMAGHMSRWDPRYLKSYETMAGHRYNLTTLAAEPNVWGVGRRGRGSVGLRIAATVRAARWLRSRAPVSLVGPLKPGAGRAAINARAVVACGSSERMSLPNGSVDLIWTDPPYHDDVQYHDLSAPFRAWLQLGKVPKTASAVAMGPKDARYADVLRRIFAECKRVLASHGRLLITYANRDSTAWIQLCESLRRAGFRARGYEIIRSDAEVDFAKRKGRGCSMDLILDLVPAANGSAPRLHRPRRALRRREWSFLSLTGEAALTAIVDEPPKDWKERLRDAQAACWG
jgi:adenine-specific DNA methylase